MNNEFKKVKIKNETRYVLENASAGATSTGAVATSPSDIKMLQRRLAELKDKVSVPVSKPRNPVGMGSTQGRGTQKHQPNQRQKSRDEKKLYELEKPSGQMFLKFRGKRLPNDEMMVLAYGGFGTTPKDVTVANAKVKPFAADEASDVISHIRKILNDKDFIGVEKIVLDIPNQFAGQLRDIIDYADRDERLELYTGGDEEEPEANTGGKVIGYGPDGKKIDRTPPKAQVGGSSRGVASTGMVTVQASSDGQRLISGLVSQGKLSRDTKVQGNKITLRKDDYSKMMSVLGNAKFQQMFTKVGSVAEGDNQDHEISMASSELQSITKDAAQLLDMVRQKSEEEGLEAWQQSKITKAADFMNSVLQSLSGDEQGMAEGYGSFQGKLDREKADFKRRELDAELGDEGGRNYRPASPPPKGMYFYNVRPGEERTAQMVGLKQTKNGKWYSKYPNPEAGGKFGPGKYWEPKSEGMAEGPEENKKWRDQARDASKEKRPWSPTNLPNYKKSKEQGVEEGSGPQKGDPVYYGSRLVGWFLGYSKYGKVITKPNYDEMGDEYANRDVYWDKDAVTIKSDKQGVAASDEFTGELDSKGRFTKDTVKNMFGKLSPDAKGVAEDDGTPGYIKYEQMKDKIASVLIKLYDQGNDEETIKQMSSRVARHLGYNPEDPIYQDAWMSSFTDASLDGSLDGEPEDDYTDYTMRQGELGRKGMSEGMDSLSFWKREAQKAGGATNIDWYAIGVEHGKQGIVMNPPYGVGGKAVTLYGKGLNAGKQGIAEGNDPASVKFGKYIEKYFGQVYDYGDAGLDYLDNNAPLWANLFNKHNSDIDAIIANEPADVLKKAAIELKGIASDLPYELGEQGVAEGLRDPKDNPCWKGYKPVGTKKKNGKTVPNCVPTNEDNYFNHLTTALESKLKK